MFAISQEFFLYIIPLIFYLFILFKKKSIKPILSLLVGYSLVLMIISFHNYKRIGEPNLSVLSGGHTALYIYFAPHVLAKKNNSSIEEATKKMNEQTKIGVGKLFGPGTPVQVSLEYIEEWVREHRR